MTAVSLVPRATYRLQLTPEFGFAAAMAVVPYLAALGVSHLYLSPIMQAAPGSTHGYDVADPARVSATLGGEAAFRALAAAAHAHGLGVLVDTVPNHVAANPATPLWRELLTSGREGPAAAYFDVDWDTPLPGAAGKVVLPVLGDQYGVVLHAGELAPVRCDGTWQLAYHAHRLPLSARASAALDAEGAAAFAGQPGDAASWRRLHALLEGEHYRLVDWRAGSGLVNYRRFFSINDLAAVRVEDAAVFEATHAKLLALVADGTIDALRVDHPDGLRDPARYFARLGERTGGIYTVAEKITAPGERLREWAAAGTTGYEFASEVLGLFVDPAGEAALAALDAALGGSGADMARLALEAKREVLLGELESDLRRLARLVWPVLQRHLEHRDVSSGDLALALAELIAALPVYRTYVDPETGDASPADTAEFARALDVLGAGHERASLHRFLAGLLLGRHGRDPATLEIIARFPQVSSPATAKGIEDTAFYRYRRLLALNEVGGEPGHFGCTVEAFHARQAERQRHTPAGMVTTATHDTKRGEDTRLRMAALSELGQEWHDIALGWWERHRALAPPPLDPHAAALIYQTLAGAWPAEPAPDWPHFAGRVAAYVVKASREAKQQTSWRDPSAAFEAAAEGFVHALLGDVARREEIGAVAARCAAIGVVSGLAQVLLRCTVPGVPDTYQGTEGWDLTLVDPDNRRPVDFAARAAQLAALDDGADPAALLAAAADGRIKAHVLARALRTRSAHAACFDAASAYVPLPAEGARAAHAVAFARVAATGTAVIAVAPARPGGLLRETGGAHGPAWGDTRVVLPPSLATAWRCVLTGTLHDGRTLDLAQLLGTLPVALLVPPG